MERLAWIWPRQSAVASSPRNTLKRSGALPDYYYDQIEWNQRCVEIYSQSKEREWTVDYGRIDETEDMAPNLDFESCRKSKVWAKQNM